MLFFLLRHNLFFKWFQGIYLSRRRKKETYGYRRGKPKHTMGENDPLILDHDLVTLLNFFHVKKTYAKKYAQLKPSKYLQTNNNQL